MVDGIKANGLLDRRFTSIRLLVPLICALLIASSNPVNADWNQIDGSVVTPKAVNIDSSGMFLIVEFLGAGLWRSFDGGSNWEPINDLLFTEPFYSGPIFGVYDFQSLDAEADSILMTCSLSNTLWGPEYSTSYLTTQAGNTWDLIWDANFMSAGGASTEEFIIRDSQADSTFYYLNAHYFAVSNNFCEDWMFWEVADGVQIKYSLHQFGDDLFYTSFYFTMSPYDELGGLYRSRDEGVTWESLVDFNTIWGLTSASVFDFRVLSNGDYLALVPYTTGPSWTTSNLIRSEDEGEDWHRCGEDLPPKFTPRKVLEDPFSPGDLYIIGWGSGLYKSEDYGENWYRMLNGLPENVSRCVDLTINEFSGEILVTIDSFGIFRSSDHGDSWHQIQGPPLGGNGVISPFESSLFYLDYGSRIWRLDDLTDSLQELPLPVLQDTLLFWLEMTLQHEDTLITMVRKRPVYQDIYYSHIARSFDDGLTWTFDPVLPFTVSSTIQSHTILDTIRFICRNPMGDSLFISNDYGYAWIDLEFPGYRIVDMIVSDSKLYAASQEGVYQYDFVTASWSSLGYSGPDVLRLGGLANDDLYVISWEGGPLAQTHRYHTGNWEVLGQIDPNLKPVTIPRSNDTLFVGAIVGAAGQFHVEVSFDYFQSWQILELDYPYEDQLYGCWDIEYDPYRELIWVSIGAGLCYLDIDEITGISLDSTNHPYKIDLEIAPNPFNSATKISYQLDRSNQVSLSVFNIKGEKLTTLFEGQQNPGTYSLILQTDGWASGIYFLNYRSGSQQQIKKLLLLK